MQVANTHPDWMLRIMQTAVHIIASDGSRPSTSQQSVPVAAFLQETFNLCLSIQEIVTALANLKILRWEPSQRINGRFSELQSSPNPDTADFMKAINQAAGVINPRSPLVIGLQMHLYASGVEDMIAAAPHRMDETQQEELDKDKNLMGLERKIELIDKAHNWHRDLEVNHRPHKTCIA